MSNTTKVVQLHDPTTDEPISPVVNVGSLYDNNGKPVDGLVAHVVAGTEVPVPKLKDVTKELQSEVDAFISTSQAQVNDLLAGGLPVADIREIMVKDGETIRPGDVVNVEREVISGTTYGDITVGSTVQLNENGTPVDYIVVHQGNPDPSIYDESCNGTWLRRKEISELIAWDTDNVATLPNADILSYFNTYVNKFDSSIQSKIKTVKIPYGIAGTTTVNTKENGIETKVFTLSAYEVGCTTDMYAHMSSADGAKLDYYVNGDSYGATQRRLAMLNGVYKSYFTRTVDTAVDYNVIGIYYGNGLPMSNNAKSADIGILPTIIIDSSSLIGDDVVYGNEYITKDVVAQENVEYTFGSSSEAVNATDICYINDAYSVAAMVCGSGTSYKLYLYLLDNNTGNKISSIQPSSEYAKYVSLSRIDDSNFILQWDYSTDGTGVDSRVFKISGSTISSTTNSMSYSAGKPKTLTYSSEYVISVHTNAAGLTCHYIDITKTTLSLAYGKTLSLGACPTYLSATNISDDSSGNKRVCICFVDATDNVGKAVIATIASSDSGISTTFSDIKNIYSSQTMTCVECAYSNGTIYAFDQSYVYALDDELNSLDRTSYSGQTMSGTYIALKAFNDGVIAVDSAINCGAKYFEWSGSNFTAGNLYAFNYQEVSQYPSIAQISSSHFLVAYGNGSDRVCAATRLQLYDRQIAGGFDNMSADAIALESGESGDTIKVGFDGYVKCAGITEGERIVSPGVTAYSPLDNWLKITGKFNKNYVIGEYTGTGTTISINLGFYPSALAINCTYSNGYGCLPMLSFVESERVAGTTIHANIINTDGSIDRRQVVFLSGGIVQIPSEISASGMRYTYIAWR